jgi:glycosyltransferase involved in cell wall biosynthesis
VTVIVPTHGRPQALERCVRALARQTLAHDRFDVVVVADGDGTGVEQALEAVRTSLSLTVLRQERAGPAAARNLGASRARSDLLAFTDDDCIPDPGWLEALAGAVERQPDAIVGGLTTNALRSNAYAEASQVLVSYLCLRELEQVGGPSFVTSNNLALTRDTFVELGGFDACFPRAGGEDRELCERWSSLGGAVRHEPAAVVRHAHTMGVAEFVRQHVEYGRGARRLHRVRARRAGEHAWRVQGPGFYLAMVRYPFRTLPLRHAAHVAALVAVSQAATAAGYALESAGGARA